MKQIRAVLMAALLLIMTAIPIKANESANYIWDYLIDAGYSEYVAAGIMGNIMTEVGGDTLDIQPTLWSSSGKYYGICQWSNRYYPDIMNCDLETQCQYLIETIDEEFAEFGYLSGYTLDDFLDLTDPYDIAIAFAKTYERCGSSSVPQRGNNANKAYQHYIDK